jgi:hypothetical protein
MADEITHEENEKEEEGPSADEALLDQIVVSEEDSAQFPAEWIAENETQINDAQRQNLYQKILHMSVPQKIRLAMLGNREARGR